MECHCATLSSGIVEGRKLFVTECLLLFLQFAVVDAPERAALTDAWKAWMEEHINNGGNVPPGNVSGNTTWTAKKARSAKPEIRLTPGAHVKLTVPLETLIDKVVKEIKVVAFVKGTRTSPQCGFSHRVLTILNEQGVDYEVVNVLDEDHNPGLREGIKKYSQWPTIPQVRLFGYFIHISTNLCELLSLTFSPHSASALTKTDIAICV